MVYYPQFAKREMRMDRIDRDRKEENKKKKKYRVRLTDDFEDVVVTVTVPTPEQRTTIHRIYDLNDPKKSRLIRRTEISRKHEFTVKTTLVMRALTLIAVIVIGVITIIWS